MDVAAAFAQIAGAVTTAFGGPFWGAVARWPGVAVKDDAGSIITPGTPISKPCQVQVDAVTDAMRLEEGFTEKDVRLLVLAASLDGELDTDARLEILTGPRAGTWLIASIPDRDPMGVYWECRGKPA